MGTDQVGAGRARPGKYDVTEQQTLQVPVSREEIRIEREPYTEANRADALSAATITKEEHEVVLHAERPAVVTEAMSRRKSSSGYRDRVRERRGPQEQIELNDPASAATTSR